MKIYIMFTILSMWMIFNIIGKDNKNISQIINDSDKVLLKKRLKLDVADKDLGVNLLKENVLASYCYVTPPPNIDVLLKKKGIKPTKINSLKIPKGWGVSYYNFFIKNIIPYQLDFTKENGKDIWSIKNRDFITVYSPLLLANCRYLLKVDVAGGSKGEIKPYFCRYTSSFKWAGKNIFPEIKINKLGSYYSYLDISNKFDGSVKLALAIKGDIKITKIALFPVKKNEDDFRSTIEGEILEISKVPNVKKSNYPDCYYTAKLSVHNILSGQAVPRTVQLVIPAFYNYKLTPLAAIKKGNKLQLRICLFDKISKKAQSIQQADDLAIFELEKYFVSASQKLKYFSTILGIVNYIDGVKYESGFEKSINPPISLKAEKARKEAMAQDLKYINTKLEEISVKEKQINESFNKSWAETQKKYDELNSKIIWGKEGNGFFALPKNYTLIPASHDYLRKNIKAIKIFQEYLRKQGVQFIVQIIPSPSDVATRVFNPQYAKYIDRSSAIVTKELLDNGIEAIYTTDAIVKRAKDYQFCFFYPNNGHPAYGCQDVMTDMMAMRLKRFDLKPDLNKKYFSIKLGLGTYGKDYKYPEKVNIGDNKANTPALTRNILYKNKFLNFSNRSKVLVIGNSFIQTPMKVAAYSSLLAMKTLYLSDNYRVGGHGPVLSIPVRLLKKKEKYLLGKKVCILPISAGFLSSQKMINIKDVDLVLRNLTNKQELYKHKITSASQNISLRPFKKYTRSWWMNFMNLNPESKQLQFKKRNFSYTIAEFEIPTKMQKKEIVIFVKLVIYPKHSGKLIINGFSNYLAANTNNSEWQMTTTKLSAKTKKIKISFKGQEDNAIIAINKISIYQ